MRASVAAACSHSGPELDATILERCIGGGFSLARLIEAAAHRCGKSAPNTIASNPTAPRTGSARCMRVVQRPAFCPAACRDRLGDRRAALPRAVAQRRRKLQPPSCPRPVQKDDSQRHHPRHHDEHLIESAAGAFDEKNRNRHQHEVESGMKDHRREQTEGAGR